MEPRWSGSEPPGFNHSTLLPSMECSSLGKYSPQMEVHTAEQLYDTVTRQGNIRKVSNIHEMTVLLVIDRGRSFMGALLLHLGVCCSEVRWSGQLQSVPPPPIDVSVLTLQNRFGGLFLSP